MRSRTLTVLAAGIVGCTVVVCLHRPAGDAVGFGPGGDDGFVPIRSPVGAEANWSEGGPPDEAPAVDRDRSAGVVTLIAASNGFYPTGSVPSLVVDGSVSSTPPMDVYADQAPPELRGFYRIKARIGP